MQPAQSQTVRFTVFAATLALFSWLFLAHFWISDDAYISFRSIKNYCDGYPLSWNTGERVQSYTHPLWVLIHLPFICSTGDPYPVTLLLAYACSCLTVLVLLTSARSLPTLLFGVVLLVSSQSFIDFSSSGLENPLSHLLIALFYRLYLQTPRGSLLLLALTGSLAVVNRQDLLLLVAIPLASLVLSKDKQTRTQRVLLLSAGFLPLILWELFSVLYYGFPVPNTYFAKMPTDVPLDSRIVYGFFYLLDHFCHDPVSFFTIFICLWLASKQNDIRGRCVAGSTALYLGYLLWIGGDYMSGRFFTPLFVLAVTWYLNQTQWCLAYRHLVIVVAAILMSWMLWVYRIPLLVNPYNVGYLQFVRYELSGSVYWFNDERTYWHHNSNPFVTGGLHLLSNHQLTLDGKKISAGPYRCYVLGSAGMTGYFAGPRPHLFEPIGLANPFVARQPAKRPNEFRPGHTEREIPEELLLSCHTGENKFTEPEQRRKYQLLKAITSLPVFSSDRWKAMADWYLGTTLLSPE